MLQRLAVLFISLFLSAPFAFAKTADTEPGWDMTSVNFAFLEMYTDIVYPCFQNARNYQGCIELMNGIGRQMAQPVQLIPRDLSLHNKGLKVEILQDMGPMLLVRVIELGDAVPAGQPYLRYMDTVNDLIRQSAEIMFRNRVPLAFKKLAHRFLEMRQPGYSEQFVIAQGVNAMLATHDPHARLIPEVTHFDQQENPEKKFVGVGIRIDFNSQHQARIRHVVEGDLFQAGDLILAVDGSSLAGLPPAEAVRRVRGPEGTNVTLQIQRPGVEAPFEVTAARRTVVTPTVYTRIVNKLGKTFAHLTVSTFNDVNLCNKLKTEVLALSEEIEGIILDLRDNPGGIRAEGICAGGIFLGEKLVMFTRPVVNGELQEERHDAIAEGPQLTALPMVTLIDGASTSAAEILAGALQDHKRSFVVGARSFGKGTLQKGDRFRDFPGVAIYHTIAQFFQPNGSSNQIVGIQPDFRVPIEPGAAEDEGYLYREETLYKNTISAGGVPWVQARGEEIARLEKRIAQNPRAEEIYLGSDGLEDYQLLKAQEILSAQIDDCEPKLEKP